MMLEKDHSFLEISTQFKRDFLFLLKASIAVSSVSTKEAPNENKYSFVLSNSGLSKLKKQHEGVKI